jgi:hypothetical protein
MRRVVAALVLGILVLTMAIPAAYAGTVGNVALGLASFAVFTQLFGGLFLRPAYAYPAYYYGPPAYYSAPIVVERPVYHVPPAYTYRSAPPPPRVVQYPHGRYELRGDGVSTAYQWVWIPNPPPPPPAPAAPPAPSSP